MSTTSQAPTVGIGCPRGTSHGGFFNVALRKGELLCSCIVVLIRIVKDVGVGLYIMITWDFVMKTTFFAVGQLVKVFQGSSCPAKMYSL